MRSVCQRTHGLEGLSVHNLLTAVGEVKVWTCVRAAPILPAASPHRPERTWLKPAEGVWAPPFGLGHYGKKNRGADVRDSRTVSEQLGCIYQGGISKQKYPFLFVFHPQHSPSLCLTLEEESTGLVGGHCWDSQPHHRVGPHGLRTQLVLHLSMEVRHGQLDSYGEHRDTDTLASQHRCREFFSTQNNHLEILVLMNMSRFLTLDKC